MSYKYLYIPNTSISTNMPLFFCWQRATGALATGAERGSPPTAMRAVPAQRKARVLPKIRFWARGYPYHRPEYTKNTKYTKISRGFMTKNEKLVGDLWQILISCQKIYQKIILCLLCIDKPTFDVPLKSLSAWVTQRVYSLRSYPLNGRRAMRDVNKCICQRLW
jgi:hypothetical protein